MLHVIVIAEAIGATIAASSAIAVAVTQWRRAEALEMEVRQRVSDVTSLSIKLDEVRRRSLRKPGPSRRAESKALIASKTAALRREVTN